MMNDQLKKSTTHWYIKKGGKVTGPFPVKLIGSYLVLGRIDLDTMVSTDEEKWIPIGRLPSLIPDEVKNASTVEGKATLDQSRNREDERRGESRRSGQNRRSGDREEAGRRQSDDRRKNDEEVSKSYLRLKSDYSNIQKRNKKRALFGLGGLVIIVLALLVSFFLVEPVMKSEKTDCDAKAKPGVDWRSCNKNSINLVEKNLSNSNLHSSHFNGALLVGTNFTGSTLSYANFENANLSNAVLKSVKLIGANLNNANLTNIDLSAADLSYADLRNATIANVKVLNTRFDYAIWTDGKRCARHSIDRCVPESK